MRTGLKLSVRRDPLHLAACGACRECVRVRPACRLNFLLHIRTLLDRNLDLPANWALHFPLRESMRNLLPAGMRLSQTDQ